MALKLLPRLRAFVPRLSAPLLPLARRAPLARPFHLSVSRPSASAPRPPSPSTPSLPPDSSLSQRLKLLIKSYGWYALGVYMVFSALDFAVAFAAVNLLGADYVAGVAASVKASIYNMFPSQSAEPGLEELDSSQATAANGHEGLYAMLVLAYTIHKTLFLPVRVGLTAAFTPRLVTWLKAKGWAGGEGTRRAAAEMRAKLRERSRRVDD
ncbi:hypothetical protein AX14_012761 [Amanita brunnescens Koide BX004]|nr:hypothetical protein AX14_012761 [Amanita brunnescens Koide BX004]